MSDVEEESQKVPVKELFRNVRDHIDENPLSYVDPRSNLLEKQINKIHSTFGRVTKTSDAISADNLVLKIAKLSTERVKNVHCEFRGFNGGEFMDKIRHMMIKHNNKHEQNDSEEDEDEDDEYALTRDNIINFGRHVLPYFRIIPRATFLLGSLDKEIVQPAARKQREVKPRKEKLKVDKEAVRTQIKELNKENVEDENDKNPTVSEIERIYSILKKYHKKKGSPIGLYEFIINPTSFSRSIENMFYLSFLIKDGYAKLFIDSTDGLPVIEPIIQDKQQQKEKKSNQTDGINYQSMISLTKPEWREIVDVFKIQVQVIPDPPVAAKVA